MNCLRDSLFIKTVRDQLLHFLTASNASPLSQLIALMCGFCPCFSFPILRVQVWSCLLSFSFFLSSFFLLNFAWNYMFCSGGQGLLPALSWCYVRSSAGIPDAFMSTYSSTILSFCPKLLKNSFIHLFPRVNLELDTCEIIHGV